MRKSVLGQISTWAVLPALAGSALAQDQNAPAPDPFVYSLTGGVMGMTLPSLPSGVVDATGTVSASGGQTAFGPMIGIDLGRKLGRVGDFDIAGNLSFFIGTLSSSGTAVTNLSGPGTVRFSSNTQSTATIDLTTSTTGGTADSDAVVNLTVPGGFANQHQTVQSLPGQNAVSNWAVTLTSDNTGVVFGGVTTNGSTPSATAVGAAADPTGFTFVGTGDLSGLKVTTTTTRSVVYMGADAAIGFSPPSIDSTSFTPYASLGYRLLRQNTDSRTTFDLPTPSGTGGFPLLGLQRLELLDTNYYGGGLGLAVSHTVDNDITISGTAEFGVRGFDARYTGRDLAIFPINNGGLELQRFDVGRAAAEANGVAWFGKGEAGINFPLGPNVLLGVTGTVEYLSKVPTLSRTAPAVQVSQSGSNATLNYPSNAGAQSTSISFTDSWNFGIKATISGAF